MSAPQIINVPSPVARRLRGCLRAVDTPSRLGGDEFAFLLENVAEPTAALEVAERIRAAMAEPFPVAMYAAKRGGGGRVRLFDSTMDWREPAA